MDYPCLYCDVKDKTIKGSRSSLEHRNLKTCMGSMRQCLEQQYPRPCPSCVSVASESLHSVSQEKQQSSITIYIYIWSIRSHLSTPLSQQVPSLMSTPIIFKIIAYYFLSKWIPIFCTTLYFIILGMSSPFWISPKLSQCTRLLNNTLFLLFSQIGHPVLICLII